MLAFAKDITQGQPTTVKESENDELKQYMEYQRKLNHERLVYLRWITRRTICNSIRKSWKEMRKS